jgi:hypothetical protein
MKPLPSGAREFSMKSRSQPVFCKFAYGPMLFTRAIFPTSALVPTCECGVRILAPEGMAAEDLAVQPSASDASGKGLIIL